MAKEKVNFFDKEAKKFRIGAYDKKTGKVKDSSGKIRDKKDCENIVKV